MFPSAGLFRDVSCPYFIFGLCERPYCHFKHSKNGESKEKKTLKSLTSGTESSTSGNDEKYSLPTSSLQRTLNEVEENIKNEKQRSSNNKSTNSNNGPKPETVQSSGTPEYNPTPIQELKRQKIEGKLGRSKYDLALLNEPASAHEYDPASNFSTSSIPEYAHSVLGNSKGLAPNEEDEDEEYDPVGKIPKFVSVEYTPTVIEPAVSDEEPLGDKEDWFSDSENESSKTSDCEAVQSSERTESVLQSREIKKVVETAEDSGSSSLPLQFTADGFIKIEPVKSSVSSTSNKVKEKKSQKVVPGKDRPKEKDNIFSIFRSMSDEDTYEDNTQSKSDAKISSKQISNKANNKSSGSKSSHHKTHRNSNSHSTDLHNSTDKSLKRKHSDSRNGVKGDKSKSSEKRSRLESGSKSSDTRQRTERHNSDPGKSKSDHREKSQKERHRSEHRRDSSDKQRTPQTHRRSSSGSSSGKGKHSESKSSHGKSKSKSKPAIVNLNVDLFGADSEEEEGEDNSASMPVDDDFDEYEDFDKYFPQEDPYDECLRIFNENKTAGPSSSSSSLLSASVKPKKKSSEEPSTSGIPPPALGKKRIALKASTKDDQKQQPKIERPAPKPSPAQVMMNRYKMMQQKALEAQEAEKKKIKQKLAEQKMAGVHISKPTVQAPPSLMLNMSNNPLKIGKKKPSSTRTTKKTVAVTASKGSKRQAHVPNMPVEKLKRPVVEITTNAKVPANIRQRYLDMIINECLKLCSSEKVAFQKAKKEEEAVYERCTNKKIYLNLVVNAIKRLRVEITNKDVKPSTSKSKVSPIKLSHEAMLGGAMANKASFTLHRSGGGVRLQVEDFKGIELYQRLKPYLLEDQQLKENNFPRPNPDQGGTALFFGEKRDGQKGSTKGYEKLCVRCGKVFEVYPNGKYAKKEECVYHWGKAWQKKIAGAMEARYTCCSGDLAAEGCQVAKAHVHETNKTEILTGYMKTIPCSPPPDGDYGVYALDCEMVYTNLGVELARVTVVGADQEAVYETFVKPDKPVIDYNTRFSGITEEDMQTVTTTLRDVQAVLLSLFTDKTILIGHSLESDLTALKLIHSTVVDTSVVFPHRLGPPKKRALKTLMVDYLKKIIQDDVAGHDSMEDAVSCVQLMQWKLKEDARKEGRRLVGQD